MKFVVQFDQTKMTDTTMALVGIKLNSRNLNKKLAEISKIPGVSWCCSTSGTYDIIFQVLSINGIKGLDIFFNDHFRKVENISSSDTMIVLKRTNNLISLPENFYHEFNFKKYLD